MRADRQQRPPGRSVMPSSRKTSPDVWLVAAQWVRGCFWNRLAFSILMAPTICRQSRVCSSHAGACRQITRVSACTFWTHTSSEASCKLTSRPSEKVEEQTSSFWGITNTPAVAIWRILGMISCSASVREGAPSSVVAVPTQNRAVPESVQLSRRAWSCLPVLRRSLLCPSMESLWSRKVLCSTSARRVRRAKHTARCQ